MVEETSMTLNKPKVHKEELILCSVGQCKYLHNSTSLRHNTIDTQRVFIVVLWMMEAKTTRPKAVHMWTVGDIEKWFKRHCSEYYNLYWEQFKYHDITGRALVRVNDNTLLRMGITNREHRETIWREILKLRLKTDIMEIRDLERRDNYCQYDM